MRKKSICLAFLVVMAAMLLSGCVYGNVVVNVNADGSGTGVAELGFSKEIFDHLGKTMKDYTSNKNENHIVKANGMEYIAETYADAFTTPETIHWSSGVSMITEELGPVRLYSGPDGVSLLVALFDEYSPNMQAEHVVNFDDINSITDSSLTGMTLPDLIAQDAPGLQIKVTFNMPYEVKQVGGGTDGVTVSGKTITLDYVKMIKSGDREWGFDSLKTYSEQQTQPAQSQSTAPAKTDVPKNTAAPVESVTSENSAVQENITESEVSSTPASEISSSSDPITSSEQEPEITVGLAVSSDPPQEDSSITEPVSAGAAEPDTNEPTSGINYVFIGVIALGVIIAVFVFIYIKRKKNDK